MKCNFIYIKLKAKNIINLNNNKILNLFKLSVGNNIINLNYNKNKKESSNQEIIYYKRYIKKDIGKMIYLNEGNNLQIKIFQKIFIYNNLERAKIIIYNKQYELKENIRNRKQTITIKIKIKFLDNIIYLNSMFEDCKSLFSIYNLQNINTKYLKTINHLFAGCSSLLYLDDISNWNINNIN